MSWQKIFKAAHRLKAPVIFTDQDGKDPMVILPLNRYEELLDQGGSESRLESSQIGERYTGPDDRTLSVFELPYEEPEAPKAKVLAKKKDAMVSSPVEQGADIPLPVAPEIPEISLDERFYFEPLEDEPKK